MSEEQMKKYIYCYVKRNSKVKLHLCENCCKYLLSKITVLDLGDNKMIIHSEFNINIDVCIVRLKTSFIMNTVDVKTSSVYNDIYDLFSCDDKKEHYKNIIYHYLWRRLDYAPEIPTNNIIEQIPKSLADIIYRVYCTNELTQLPEKYYTFLLIFRFYKPYGLPYDIVKLISQKILFFKIEKQKIKIEKTKKKKPKRSEP